MRRFLFIGAIGTAIVYFLDPDKGRSRRAMARDRIPALLRRRAERLERAGRAVSAQAQGAAQKAQHLQEEEKPQPDDATLAHKVESEVFRDADMPKGQINVNAEHGVVVLRGEVGQPELIRDLEERTRKVQGVREVENLLHLPGTPAPTR